MPLVKHIIIYISHVHEYCRSALQNYFSNLSIMMIRRNQILAVKRQILPIIHFAAPKIENIRANDVFLTGNCFMRELHLLQVREWIAVLGK